MKLYQEAEKYITDIYWNESHDSHSKLNVPKIIEEKLLHDNANKDIAYYEHREGVIHATSVAKCLRGVIHGMLGAKKDNPIETRILGVFKAGNLFEDFIIQALGDRIVHQQREYTLKYKNITLVGRSDFTIDDEGTMRVGECKSVHSDAFWFREREGTLIAWHNQIQLQIYMWLERTLNGNNWDGIFTYISKDDCTVISAPVKFNQHIIDEIVIPALDILNEAYTAKNPELAPVPESIVFNESKRQFQKNWLAKYCEYHESCIGKGWILEATNLVTDKNKEFKKQNPHLFKRKTKAKAEVEVVGKVEPIETLEITIEEE